MGEIDFIIPWVDGSDPQWQKKKNQYLGNAAEDGSPQRYRDWDLLRYWFRGVEKYAPWVRRIWFICDQQPPNWLYTKHPKLRIVHHEDFIPKEYLPVFSSHPIELNMHRIPGLNEQFVYFNDDTFLLQPVTETFFFKEGLPRDCALLNPVPTDDLAKGDPDARIFTIFLNNAEYMNRDYDFHKCLRQHPWKWFHYSYGRDLLRNMFFSVWPRFVGFVEHHLPAAYLKSSFEKAWQRDADILDETSRHPIRNDRDVNQWLIRNQQLAEGKFIPRRPLRNLSFLICNDEDRMHSTIRRQLAPMICLNDAGIDAEQIEEISRKIHADFDSVLPEKSSFETC